MPPPRSLAGTRKARIAAVAVTLGFGLLLAGLRWAGVVGASGPATPRPVAQPTGPPGPAGAEAAEAEALGSGDGEAERRQAE